VAVSSLISDVPGARILGEIGMTASGSPARGLQAFARTAP
jgi:hypothetical protein